VARERGLETERLLLSELKADFCSDCGDCSKGRRCPIEDDMQLILDAFLKADGIIVASLVYFGCMSAQLKAVLDRTIPLRCQGFRLKGKWALPSALGGARNGGQEKTIEAIHAWMHIRGMIIVGDDAHFGGIAVRPLRLLRIA
jgi:multimeric flavodoxin WrbA